MRITARDIEITLRAADRLAAEAQTWREGFAGSVNGKWTWNGEFPEIELRVMKLECSEARLRVLATKLKRMKEHLPRPEVSSTTH